MIIDTSKEITNIQIMNVANVLGINKNMLKIIMKDQVELIKKNQYYIINLDKPNGDGTHWTALICTKNECMYIDSYGTPPPEKISNTLKKMYSKVHFSDFIIQNIKSVACGYYALAFILVYHKYKNLNYTLLQISSKYIDYFDDDTTKNDYLLSKLYLNVFK